MEWRRLTLVSLLVSTTAAAAPTEAAPTPVAFDPGDAGFTMTVQGVENRYRVFGIYVLPKETVHLECSTQVTLQAGAGKIEIRDPHTWQWTAPKTPGLVPLTARSRSGAVMTLNAFVLRPAAEVKDGALDGYRLGAYPAKPLKNLAVYRPPKGFLQVTPDLAGARVSPHFTLGQFVCKQAAGGAVPVVVLREALLLKLERILQEVNYQGYRVDTFVVMSGYRTPFYNRAIGNVQYSRHIYGGAADIFIDASPEDGVIDDLNRDGRVDRRDAAVLYDLIERLSRQEGWSYPGGLGEYDATETHGPFVHVDSRGRRARWGR